MTPVRHQVLSASSGADWLEARAAMCRVGGTVLLPSVTARFQAGRLSAIVGPNGAGKSSLLSLLSGQRPAQSGSVWMNGRPLRNGELRAQARTRAVLSQDNTVAFDYSVRNIVELGRYPHLRCPSPNEAGIVQAAMQATGVAALAGRAITSLSGGERARAQLARVLAQIWEPPPGGAARWLLLDEPTAALDLGHQHEVLRLARSWAQAQGVGVVAVLHDLNLALRYADWTLVLQRGAVHDQGPPAQTLTPLNVSQVWGLPSQMVSHADGCPQLLIG